MKGKKKFAHLKPAVLQAFQEGKSGAELVEFFQIPKSTVYDWIAEFRNEFRKLEKQEKDKPTTPKKVSEKAPEPVPVEVLEPYVDVLEITKDYEHLSDFEVGRKVLRAIALSPDSREASRIQASIALIRSVEIGHDLPKHILEGKEENSIASERKKLEGMSVEELAREYKRMLEAT